MNSKAFFHFLLFIMVLSGSLQLQFTLGHQRQREKKEEKGEDEEKGV